jgi:hypothetical protein
MPQLLGVVGMETSLFGALIVWTALAYDRGWGLWIGAFAGLTALGRPEGIVMVALLAGFDVYRRRRFPHRIVWPALALIVLWEVIVLGTTHSLIPHTLRVKATQMAMSPEHWFTAFVNQIPHPNVVVALLSLGVIELVIRIRKGETFALIVMAFGLIQVVGYSVAKAPWWYLWYNEPGNLAWLLGSAFGVLFALRPIQSLIEKRLRGAGTRLASARWSHATLQAGISGLGIFAVGAIYSWQAFAAPGIISSITKPYRMSTQYIEVAGWLKARGGRNDWVAAQEIGYLGFYSELRVRDMMGLLENNSVESLSRGRWDWWFTNYREPRFIVLHIPQWPLEPEPPGSLNAWPQQVWNRFIADYAPVHSVEVPHYIVNHLEVYELRSELEGRLLPAGR